MKKVAHLALVVLLLLPSLYAQVKDWTDTVSVSVTVKPLEQLTDDFTQILNSTYHGGAAAYGFLPNTVAGSTGFGSAYGVCGFDQGYFAYLADNSLLFMPGDTETCHWDAGANGGAGAMVNERYATCGDASGVISCPSNTGVSLFPKVVGIMKGSGGNPPDFSNCNAIPGVDTALTGGNPTPAVDYTGCPPIEYITNTSRAASYPLAAVLTASGLGTDAAGTTERITGGRTASDMFFLNNHMYVIWNLSRPACGAVGSGNYICASGGQQPQYESALMDCGLLSQFTDTVAADFTCTKKYVWSQGAYTVRGTATGSAASSTLTGVAMTAGVMAGYMCDASNGGNCTGALTPLPDGTKNLAINVQDGGGNFQLYQITGFDNSAHTITISPAFNQSAGGVSFNVIEWQEGNIGKFVSSGAEVFTVASQWWKGLLPGALQSETQIVCFVSASYMVGASNAYLGCIGGSTLAGSSYSVQSPFSNQINGAAGGIADMWYLTGLTQYAPGYATPSWTQGHEELAIPILSGYSHSCGAVLSPVGDEACFGIARVGLEFSPNLNRYTMTTWSGDLYFRTATAPWGPWSQEVDQESVSFSPKSTGNWQWQLATDAQFDYSFWTSQQDSFGPFNTVTCAGCTGGTATSRKMYESGPGGNHNTCISYQASGGCVTNSNTDTKGKLYSNRFLPYPTGEVASGNGTTALFYTKSMANPYTVFINKITVINPAKTLPTRASSGTLAIGGSAF